MEGKILVLGFLTLVFIGSVSAQAPDIDVRPDNLNNSDFMPTNSNQSSILVGKNYSTNVTFENLDSQKKAINFTLPRNPYYKWKTNDYKFNISSDELVRKEVIIDFDAEKNISDELTYEFKYNDSGTITFNKNAYPKQNVSITSTYANVSLKLKPLSDNFTIDLGENQRRVFEVSNQNNSFKVYNVRFDGGKYADSFSAEGFNLSAGKSKVIDYSAGVPKPEDNQKATDKTGQIYTGRIKADADNSDTASFNFSIDVPKEDFTLPNSQKDFKGLFNSFERFCRNNPSKCNITETVVRNNTIVKNRTVPVESNLTSQDIAKLKELAQTQRNNNKEIRQEINLLKSLVKNRFQSFENELNTVQEKVQKTREQANKTQELYSQLQNQRVQSRQSAERTFVLLFVGILFSGFFLGGGYWFVKWWRKRDDYRVI